MKEDLVKMIAIILVIILIIYLIYKTMTVKEGLVSGDISSLTKTPSVQNTTNGTAGNAANYAAAIKAATVKLQDSLLISKYRTDYENIIINMDDYLSILMLEQVLNMNTSGDQKTNIDNLASLNTIMNAKTALNQTMTYIDKQ